MNYLQVSQAFLSQGFRAGGEVSDMCQKTWEMIQDKKVDEIGLQMAIQCAPLITGLKISNLLNIRRVDFPHEMGLLLGYPAEDVDGFMRHKGKDFLCTGYWKVYEDRDRKLKTFEDFENAEEVLIQLLSCGISMGEIIGLCCRRMGTKTMQFNKEVYT
ncbi:MAG: DUF3793 family protein [Ruminococcus flavefaciens]|nr:DUF3793 family protein [Ruminococcus flavefaciens]